MSPTSAELAYIRSEIGVADPPSDDELIRRFERLGSANAVALEVIKERKAELMAAPLSETFPGEYSRNSEGNLRALERRAAKLEEKVAAEQSGTLSVGRLTRKSPRR